MVRNVIFTSGFQTDVLSSHPRRSEPSTWSQTVIWPKSDYSVFAVHADIVDHHGFTVCGK